MRATIDEQHMPALSLSTEQPPEIAHLHKCNKIIIHIQISTGSMDGIASSPSPNRIAPQLDNINELVLICRRRHQAKKTQIQKHKGTIRWSLFVWPPPHHLTIVRQRATTRWVRYAPRPKRASSVKCSKAGRRVALVPSFFIYRSTTKRHPRPFFAHANVLAKSLPKRRMGWDPLSAANTSGRRPVRV